MSSVQDSRAPQPFSPVRAARETLATALSGSLGTLTPEGVPFVSLVTVATLPDGTPILLISRLAVHTQNLARDPRASLLFVASGGEAGDPLAGARLTLVGEVGPVPDRAAAKQRFLARNPAAAGYAEFADFEFKVFRATSAHLVAGFGRIVSVPTGELFPDLAAAEEVVAGEEGIVRHMNDDHLDALSLYATTILGRPSGDWRATGSDPEGLDLASEHGRARLWYPERAESLGKVRLLLKHLAENARRR